MVLFGEATPMVKELISRAIELACQRNALLEALKGAEQAFHAITREVGGNERLHGCEEFYRGYNSVVNRETKRASESLVPIRAAIAKVSQ